MVLKGTKGTKGTKVLKVLRGPLKPQVFILLGGKQKKQIKKQPSVFIQHGTKRTI